MWIPSSLCRRKQWISADIISYQVLGKNYIFLVKSIQHFHTLGGMIPKHFWEEEIVFIRLVLGPSTSLSYIRKKKLLDLLYIGNLISVFCSTILIYSLFVHHFFIPSNVTSISLLFSDQVDYCILYFTASEIKTSFALWLEHNTRKSKGKLLKRKITS